MTVEEMDNMFDVLYNNITSNQAPGLNAYEKSIFLTKAQDEIVKNYFSPKSKGNNLQEGFDDSPKRQIDFSKIMETMTTTVFGTPTFDARSNVKSVAFKKKMMLIINEVVDVVRSTNNDSTITLQVVPVKYDEYSRLMSKPYKRPLKYQAWRLITNNAIYVEDKVSNLYSYLRSEGLIKSSFTYEAFREHFPDGITKDSEVTEEITTMISVSGSEIRWYISIDGYCLSSEDTIGTNVAIKFTANQRAAILALIQEAQKTTGESLSVMELIPGPSDTITKYTVRYIRRPNPIIVADLDGLTIEGEDTISECELDDSIHEEIVQRAVELAKIAWTTTGQDNVQLVMQAGQRSE